MQNIGKFLERESLICDTLDEISDDYSICVNCCKIKCNDIRKCYILKGETLYGVPEFELQTSCGLCGNDYVLCVDCCVGTLLSVPPEHEFAVCFDCKKESEAGFSETVQNYAELRGPSAKRKRNVSE